MSPPAATNPKHTKKTQITIRTLTMGKEIEAGKGVEVVRNIFGDVNEKYGAIAELLSNRKDFLIALSQVSSDLWQAYNDPLIKNITGRFTWALRSLANSYGFYYNDFIVYTGPLDTEKFKSYIEKGYFWKDSFAPEHGEFSHAYQWLAIARHFKGRDEHSIPTLFRETVKHVSNKTVIGVSGMGGTREVTKISMWPWLCDCFPYERLTPPKTLTESFENYESELRHTYSDTMRCPNTIELMARGLDNSFISYMANYRIKKLESDRDEMKPVIKSIYEQKSIKISRQLNDLNLISQSQTLRKERKSYFEAHDSAAERIFKRANSDYMLLSDKDIEQVEIELHGFKGTIPRHVLEGKPSSLNITKQSPIRSFYRPQDRLQ